VDDEQQITGIRISFAGFGRLPNFGDAPEI
jgi:hypothetical protein